DRRGMILGEGGAMLVLDPLKRADARGARIYGEVVGLAMSSDAGHITQPSGEGPARAMRAALRDAQLHPEQGGYINAHGTGTPGNDPIETHAIRQVFCAHADPLALLSTTSMHGDSLGSAVAVDDVDSVVAL